MVQLKLEQLSKRLGGKDVLTNLDLVLEGGNIITLLGANGAGKTTLLHLLGGLYQPSEGRILLDGQELERRDLHQRRRLHYLPDIPTLGPSQTPIDYAVYAAEAYNRTSDECDQRIVDLLAEFDLLHLADSPCRALSRGQRYKASLVPLLLIDPDVWILDEPFTSGMDPIGLHAMRHQMLSARTRGRLVIYSTQLVEIAQQTSDQICVLSEQGVAAFGTPDRLEESAEHSPELNALLQQLRGDEEET